MTSVELYRLGIKADSVQQRKAAKGDALLAAYLGKRRPAKPRRTRRRGTSRPR